LLLAQGDLSGWVRGEPTGRPGG